jgi:hypothetical protein
MRRLISIAFILAGCSGNAGQHGNECPEGKCPVNNTLVFAAEVTPATNNAAPLPYFEVGELMLDTVNARFSLMEEASVALTGTITSGADHPRPVAATVLATRPSRLVGRPDVSYQTQVDPMSGSFTLSVSPTHAGEVYTVSLLPVDNGANPPATLVVDASEPRELPGMLSAPSSLTQLSGVILDPLQMPVVGMLVNAVDPTSGVTLSTTSTTDATGAFAIKLSPPATGVGNVMLPAAATQVRLVATPPKDAVLPTLRSLVDVSSVGPTNSLTVNLMMPPLPASTTVVYSVTGTGSSGAPSAVVGAHCQFSADVSDPKSMVTATYSAASDTDADGKARVTLIPGSGATNRDYQVAVSPPSTSNFQATLTSLSVAPTTTPGYGASLMLALRDQVTGRVLGPDGMPVPNLMVVPTAATVAAAVSTSTLALTPKASSGLTDAKGQFILRLDSGPYDFGMIPPAATSLPRHWVDGQQISTDITLMDVILPAGTLVKGLITDSTGAPMVGADVRIYSLVQSNVDCPAGDNTCLAPARLVAEGQAGTDGDVPLLLPAAN